MPSDDDVGPRDNQSLHEQLFRTMLTIRMAEERILEWTAEGLIPGTVHASIGQEAVAAGVCLALDSTDIITSTHRGHGHVLAKGADVGRVLAELMGRESGTNKGRGGSMHVTDIGAGIYGANGMVGGGVPFALGAAWVSKREGSGRVAVAFFGDGALGQGVFLESLNLAALWKLPVVFLCENNQYAVTLKVQNGVAGDFVARAAGHGMSAELVDGMDPMAVYEAARHAIERARAGHGPSYLQCETYRYHGHQSGDEALRLNYRGDAELEAWKARDPIESLASKLDESTVATIRGDVERLIAEAADFAQASALPDAETVLDFVYADRTPIRLGAEL